MRGLWKVLENDPRFGLDRTAAGNNRLIIPNSTSADDGENFVTEIQMGKTTLRVAWLISVNTTDV